MKDSTITLAKSISDAFNSSSSIEEFMMYFDMNCIDANEAAKAHFEANKGWLWRVPEICSSARGIDFNALFAHSKAICNGSLAVSRLPYRCSYLLDKNYCGYSLRVYYAKDGCDYCHMHGVDYITSDMHDNNPSRVAMLLAITDPVCFTMPTSTH